MSTATHQQPTSRLGAVRSGPMKQALRHLFYGPEGVGKSTLAANAESPIIFDVEGGSSQLDVARYTFRDDDYGHVPQSLDEVYSAIEDLRSSKHEFKTLIIDTMSALEALVWDRVCKTHSGSKGAINKSGKQLSSIEDLGYGKGYTCAVDEFRQLCHALDRLRLERGITVILLGHSITKTFKNPLADDYDRIQLRMHDKAAGFVKEWCDVVGYCAFEDGVATDDGDDRARAKGYSTGRRFIHLERSAGWDAKTRIPLPPKIEMELGDSWAPFAAAVATGRELSAEDLVTGIHAELMRIGDVDLTTKVNDAVQKAKDQRSVLSQYFNNLRQRTAKESN